MPAASAAARSSAKALAVRATMGVGAPFVSTAEDILAAVGSVLAIFFPLLFVLFAAVLGYVAYRLIKKARALRKPKPAAPAMTS